MSKRFKSKKRKKLSVGKTIIVIIIIYISFNLIYNLIYNLYLSKLDNKEIINHIIANTKNSKINNSFLYSYQNPQKIIDNNFSINSQEETINVDLPEYSIPLVYIYSTHETEEYSDKYLEIYNIKPTVKTMGYILKDYLSDLGITSVVEEKSVTEVLRNHNWSYKYSYDASKEIITPQIKDNNFKLIIDLHRDSAPLSKTLIEKDNKNYARVLFIVGEEHENYTKNYQLAQTLNDYFEQEIEGISRGISKKSGEGVNGIYNQDLSPNIVLIELGGQYNEIEELNNTIEVMSKVILKYKEENL